MAVSQSDMDGVIEVTIPVDVVKYRFNGVERTGFTFKSTLRVEFQGGDVVMVPAPATFLSLPDFQVSGNGPDGVVANFPQGSTNAVIWKFEVAPRERDDFDNPASLTNISVP